MSAKPLPTQNVLGNKALVRQFWSYARHDKTTYVISFALMFLTLGSELARPLVLEQGVSHIDTGNWDALKMMAWLYLSIAIADYALRGTFTFLVSVAFLRTINRIRNALFHHVLHMRMAFFDRQPIGSLLTRTINDCEALGETLRAGISTILVDILTVVVVFGVLLHLDLGLSTVVIVAAPLVWLTVRWVGTKLREKFLEVRRTLADSNGTMAEGIAGVEVLQLFRKQTFAKDQFTETNKKYRRATIISNVYDASLYAIIDGIAALTTAAILYVALGIRFEARDIAALIVFLNIVDRIFVPIRDLSGKFATIQQALAALQRIFGLLNRQEHLPHGEVQLAGDRLNIAFQGVDFRYAEDGPQVLKDISFSVKSGQVVALVGETGSGKSTIGKLLTRSYDGYNGTIHVGDHELSELNYHSLRSKVAVVHQDVELFPGTLRDNITMFAPEIDDEKVMWAISLVKAEHMVAQLRGGLDFRVKEDGSNLSAGQSQLVVFARALAHDAPVVLMDEATASVDSVTEAWIQEAIMQIFKHKTVLIVAHRLSTIAAADNILVLKNGRVLEQGSHQTLCQIEGGYYASLVNASKMAHGRGEGMLV